MSCKEICNFQPFWRVLLISNDHLMITNFNKCESDLATELPQCMFLLGPVLGAWRIPGPPVGYLILQVLVGLLQPVHLLQEALQTCVQTPHGLTGVLQQVHGDLRDCTLKSLKVHTTSRRYFHTVQWHNTATSAYDGQNIRMLRGWHICCRMHTQQ